MIKDVFKPTFTLANLKKDLHTINEAASSYGLNLPMSSKAEEIYCEALNNGFGDLDYTGILSYIKQTNNKDNNYNNNNSNNNNNNNKA